MNDSNIHEQVLALKKASRAPPGDHQQQRHSEVPVICSVAGYNSPYECGNRANEVML